MKKKLLMCLCLALALLGAFTGAVRPAHAQTPRTLRVGYVFTTGYQEGGEGEYKTGLGYDYYQKIAYYTGWNYEYVYGGFSELLEKLQAGEIDIMGNLSYTEERAQTIDFSTHEQGWENYYLYTLKNHTDVDEAHVDALNGKKIGVSKGSVQYNMFLDWCTQHNVTCEIVPYTEKAQRESDMNNGIIDAVVVPTVMANDPAYVGWRAAVKIGESPYYFGLSKQCDREIKEQLDAALAAIFDANPNYFIDQFNKYYGGKMMESDFWTVDEQAELTRRDNCFRVGYIDNYLPFSDKTANGTLSGLLSDISRMTNDNLEIRFDCIAFARYDEMKAALDRGELDIIFPVRGDYWAAEQQKLFLSDTVCGSNSMLLYQGAYTEDTTARIAISDASPFQRYSAIINYPDAELVVCHTLDDCIRAVIDGKAGSTISLYKFYRINESNFRDARYLAEAELADSANVCFGVRHGDTMTLSICQKILKVIGDDAINKAVVSYSNYEKVYTVWEFIQENTVQFLVGALLLVVLIAAVSVIYVRSVKRRNQELLEATRETEKARHELIEQEMKAEAYRLRTEQELNNSRIKLMMNQMRPHFLYNALSAIQTIVKSDPDYAASLIYDFTTHLRSSITALSSDSPIPFSEELKNITAYLNIEKMRTGDAIKVVYDIQSDAFDVLPLSIQPFAENAARHGIYPKGEEGGTITVRSWEREDAYVVQVQDDGVGFDVEEAMNRESKSIGLKNTLFRLRTLTNADVAIESAPGEGTIVTVTIPKPPEKEVKSE